GSRGTLTRTRPGFRWWVSGIIRTLAQRQRRDASGDISAPHAGETVEWQPIRHAHAGTVCGKVRSVGLSRVGIRSCLQDTLRNPEHVLLPPVGGDVQDQRAPRYVGL